MPLFQIDNQKLSVVEQKDIALEKDLQKLIEENLEVVFSCRFIASEFSTGAVHAGRIDTLALSEDDNPVIIEYKKVESSSLINQSLFYLHWIYDHKGDFELAVHKKLGSDTNIDWSDVRVICIAPNYKKYDLHAVQVMGANIELWKYRLFANNNLYLEEIYHDVKSSNSISETTKSKTMVEAGKKAAIVRATATYTFEEHIKGVHKEISDLVHTIREFILALDSSIDEVPKKYYVAYKGSKNIVCMEVKKNNIKLWVKLKKHEVENPPSLFRDMSNQGCSMLKAPIV